MSQMLWWTVQWMPPLTCPIHRTPAILKNVNLSVTRDRIVLQNIGSKRAQFLNMKKIFNIPAYSVADSEENLFIQKCRHPIIAAWYSWSMANQVYFIVNVCNQWQAKTQMHIVHESIGLFFIPPEIALPLSLHATSQWIGLYCSEVNWNQ